MTAAVPLHGISRRHFVASLALAPLLPRLAGAATLNAPAGSQQAFALSELRLGDGVFAQAHARNLRYIAALDPARLLAPFRREAGLPAQAEPYPNWESMGLDGHTAGHYLSALAQEAANGDAAMRQRLDAMVAALAACQQANGDGYVGGVPGSAALWRNVRAGRLHGGTDTLDDRWVPLYNLHKTFAGLRDAWLYAGNAQARQVLVGFADWAGALVAGLDDDQLQQLLDVEHGGINEVLADVAAITGERRYLALARRYSHRALLDPLLRREDRLDGLHANTQIPKVIGFARIAELDGDTAWHDAAVFFWETVAERRSIAFGGNSVREHFNPVDDFAPMLESREGPETCNSYNMLRLTLQLYRRDPQPRYADYYERALYNHILSSQHPGHGGLVYFTPIRPRHYRVYSQPQQCFWCCVGTGIENHGRHAAFAYLHDADSLTVNLYMASQLQWRARGLLLRQDTRFPDAEASTLTLQLQRRQRFALRLRHPAWLAGALQVRINGSPWPVASTPSSYARIERVWHDGDRVEIALPMTTRAEPLPDGSPYVALLHGPIVLAARTGTDALTGLVADAGRGSHIAPGPYLPLDQAPMLVGDADALAAALHPVAGQPLTFTASSLIQPPQDRALQLEPLFRIHDARYMVYWRTASTADYPAVQRALAQHEQARQRREARTLDRVAAGEQQPEADHRFRGEDSAAGLQFGLHWRDTGGWLSYRLQAPDGTAADTACELLLVFDGSQRNDGFALEVDGQRLATLMLDGGAADALAERSVVLPPALARKALREGIEVTLRATPGQRSARLFELRLQRRDDD